MKQLITLISVLCAVLPSTAQTLSLDSCRAMALRNNKQLAMGRVEKDIAYNIRKSARTKYLPRITALGGYELMSKEISLLNNAQKSFFENLGTNAIGSLTAPLAEDLTSMVQEGIISPETAQKISQEIAQGTSGIASYGNGIGEKIKDAFRTDTRQIFAGSVTLTQPIFMGGAITAMNRMADIQERLAANHLDQQTDEMIYNVDHTYWLVVSLRNKYKLAQSFNKLVTKLNDDVQKMIREGVATRADGLKVAVKVNESEMALTQAENGISLAKMLLCQECGLPLDSDIVLEDENSDNLAIVSNEVNIDTETAISNRPETRMLEDAVSLSREATNLVRAAFLPQVALTGGYLITNPNLYNGFEKKFSGIWNVGIIARIPVWNWFESTYKIRASKATTVLAEYKLTETKEKMELQIQQAKFKVSEANKRLTMADKNIKSAEENLRCADIGFKEGVISSTDVIGAQTAWYQAHSQKIDAEIEVRMCQLNLKKSLGEM